MGSNRSLILEQILQIQVSYYVTMAPKRARDEEKSDFGILAFLVVCYINKACLKILS